MINSRTWDNAVGGHSATSVGTVETTVMSLATSQGPTSTPLRTSDRGAGTRQAPLAQASQISSQLASKATDRPAITRSPGPIGSAGCCRNSCDSASTNAAALRWVTATPLGVPVDPEVKMIQASSSGVGGLEVAALPGSTVRPGVAAAAMARSLPTTARTCASPNTSRARSSGSSASTGT